MPMDFHDLATLRRHFDDDKAVPYRDGESEADYRERCAVWSEQRWGDFVQAREIRSGKGWDKDNPGAALTDILIRQARSGAPRARVEGLDAALHATERDMVVATQAVMGVDPCFWHRHSDIANEVIHAVAELLAYERSEGAALVVVAQRTNGCYAACIASLTRTPLDEIPHPLDEDFTPEAWLTYRNTLNRFLRKRGWWRVWIPADTPPRGLAIAHGDGPRGMGHCCIMRNGLIVMDPHPSGDGLVSVEGYEVLVRCAPLATEARTAAALTEAAESGGARVEKMTADALPCEACGSTHSGRCAVMGEPAQRPAFHPAEGAAPPPPRASEPEGTEPIDGEWTGPEMQGDEHGHWRSAEFPGECIDGCSGCEEGNPLPSWRVPRAQRSEPEGEGRTR